MPTHQPKPRKLPTRYKKRAGNLWVLQKKTKPKNPNLVFFPTAEGYYDYQKN
jgi:hypothetical protein